MCDPVSIGLSIGGALLQRAAQNQQIQAGYDAAAEQTALSYQQIAEQEKQINQQSGLDQSERIKQGMVERAQMATIAGESGALGFSSDRLIGDSYMQQGLDISSMETNRQNSIKQAEWEKKKAQGSANARTSELEASSPSWVATGLQIAGDGYKVYKDTKTKTASKTGVS